jgi:hypothetical protein
MIPQQSSVLHFHFPLFDVNRIYDVPKGFVFYGDPAKDDAIPGMTPNTSKDSEIAYIPKGSWRIDTRLHPEGGFDAVSGEGLWPDRWNSRIRFTATGDVNGWICVQPKDSTMWNRSLVKIHDGDSMTLDVSSSDQYLVIVEGCLLTDLQHNKNEMVKIPANTQPKITAQGESIAIRLWR